MNDSSQLPEKLPSADSAVSQTLDALAEFLTGLASANKKEWALSIGYLLQRIRGKGFLFQLDAEIKKYREKGKIKADYLQTPQGLDCIQQVLEFLDKDVPDETRFKAVKTVFLKIASEELSDRDDPLPLQLMHLLRSLTAGEILVLLASYKLANDDGWQKELANTSLPRRALLMGPWLKSVMELSGLRLPELVKANEFLLMQKRLLTGYAYADGSAYDVEDHHRLTGLGYKLCQFIEELE